MAGKIRLLSDEVIGKIAAGEVVERPSAAIKEMVENSLDAGATAVTVEIRDGGISYFRVTDNGSGIQQSEIRMAFERHATSKISSAQELSAIQTLGFRGEALASIAAVSRVSCTTRTRNDASGVKVVNAGGRIESIEETACPEGTTFVVRDLFFNTPVRLKFLKKPTTEAGYVTDLMMRLILSRPDVSFRYICQGKTLYHSAGDGKLASAVFSIYGKEMRTMYKVHGHEAGIIADGYVGVSDNARSTRSHQSFFINGRYMKSALLSASVEAACRDLVPQGRYPSCVLHLTMPYDMVDVNVHPNKLECRFQNELALSAALEAVIRESMAERNPLESVGTLQLNPSPAVQTTPVVVNKQETIVKTAPAISAKAPVVASTVPPAAAVVPLQTSQPAANVTPAIKTQPASDAIQPVKPQTAPLQKATVPQQPQIPGMKPLPPISRPVSNTLRQTPAAVQTYMQSYQQLPPVQPISKTTATEQSGTAVAQTFLPDVPKELRIIGNAFNSYILVEYNDHLLMIDQQGVHERLLYDRMEQLVGTESCSQELLVPIILPATRREQQLLEDHQNLLQAIGLNVEIFGENEVAIRAIPMILGQPQAGGLLREIIAQLEAERGVITLEKRRSGLLALACKKAVRSGERLREEDLRELVERMVDKKIVPASPRGNPLIVALSHTELDRRFRRPQ